MCLGEDVVVLVSYTLVGPTFLLKLHHAVAMAAAQITFVQLQSVPLLMQMAAPTVAICLSLSYRLVPVFWVPCHACAWCDSIKGLVGLALGSLFG